MRPSRGMGIINPSKMPKAKTIIRKDDPNRVKMFAKGGKVKKMAEGDFIDEVKLTPAIHDIDPKNKTFSTSTRVSGKKKLGKNTDIEAYVDADVFKNPDQGVRGKASNVGLQFTHRFKAGGEAKSKVNEAGNYTKPTMRKRLFEQIKAGGKGGAPGQWSARKAQMLATQYKKSGGGYRG